VVSLIVGSEGHRDFVTSNTIIGFGRSDEVIDFEVLNELRLDVVRGWHPAKVIARRTVRIPLIIALETI